MEACLDNEFEVVFSLHGLTISYGCIELVDRLAKSNATYKLLYGLTI